VFIRAPAGRQRFNVLAALNAITHELYLTASHISIFCYPKSDKLTIS